jgi:hypothetical protein
MPRALQPARATISASLFTIRARHAPMGSLCMAGGSGAHDASQGRSPTQARPRDWRSHSESRHSHTASARARSSSDRLLHTAT